MIAGKTRAQLPAIVARVAAGGGPSASGTTAAEFVRFHDDLSTYTGKIKWQLPPRLNSCLRCRGACAAAPLSHLCVCLVGRCPRMGLPCLLTVYRCPRMGLPCLLTVYPYPPKS